MKNLQRGFAVPLLLIVILIGIGGGLYLYSNSTTSQSVYKPPTTTPKPVEVIPYGNVTLKVGESAKFANNSLRLIRIVDDSRCATGVTCIWAGTLHAEVAIVKDMTTGQVVIELGKSIATDSLKITLLSAVPYPKAGVSIKPSDYTLKFEVVEKSVVVDPKPKGGACYTGGCSGEICSDRKDMASTCIYRAEYACYKTARCERQASGQCGWTETSSLRMCIEKPPTLYTL